MLSRLDRRAFDWVVRRRAGPLDTVVIGLSHAGKGGVAWGAAAGAAALSRAPGARAAFAKRGAATIWGAYLVSLGIGRIVSRVRPCQRGRVRALVQCPEGPSFPSDQAATSAAGALFLAAAEPELAPAFLALAGAIAYARVSVGVHYPTDVVGGAALGATWALAVRAFRRER